MRPTTSTTPPERSGVRQGALWGGFLALLLLGVVLYFRFAGRVAPLLDAAADK